MSTRYKIIGCTPAGRRRYLEVLVPHILRHRDLFDHYQLWANTPVPEDLEYLNQLEREYPGVFRVVASQIPFNGIASICHFWQHVCDPEALYIRLDDDIVWCAPDALPTLAEYRLAHPEPFLVYGNIINNLVCSYLHQRLGALPLSVGQAKYDARHPALWGNGPYAEKVHRAFLEALHHGQLEAYRFERWRCCAYERVSINVISWFGRDLRPQEHHFMHYNEEDWVASHRPQQLQRPNEICGQALFAHFAYHQQRGYLDQTDLLAQYRQLQTEAQDPQTEDLR